MNSDGCLRVLCLSGNFPNPVRPYEGCWAYTQFKALAEHGADIRVLSPYTFTLFSLRELSTLLYAIRRPRHWTKAGLVVEGPKMFYLLSGKRFRPRYPEYWRRKLADMVGRLREEWPFDIVYTQSIVPEATAFLHLSNVHRASVSGCVIGEGEVTRNIEDSRIRELTIDTLRNLDLVVAESNRVANLASELISGVRPIYGVHRGTFPEDMSFDEERVRGWRKKLGLGDSTTAAMYVGHLYETKGVIDLLEAFRKICKEMPWARLVYIGKGNQEKRLRELSSSDEVRGKVILGGAVAYSEVPNVMRAADFICSPSHAEGLGMVNVEAGFCERAVVGARTGGIPEAISDGETGLLFEPKNRDDLAEKLRLMFNNKEMRELMGKRAYDFVNEHHNAHRTTKRLYDLLLGTVQRKKGLRRSHK